MNNTVEAPAFRAGARKGHVESWFVKLNAPTGDRALWLRWTLFAEPGIAPRAECWALAFRRGGPHRAFKRSMPYAPGLVSAGPPYALDFGGARFDGTRARGSLASGASAIAWDLALAPRTAPLRQLPYAWLYKSPFPESKFTTPVPDADVSGHFTLDGEYVAVDGWRAMHGHNWGTRNAQRYAWCHAAGFGPDDDDVIFEGVSVRLRKAGVELPWATLAFLRTGGAWVRFDAPAAIMRARVGASVMRWHFELESGLYRIRGEASARPADVMGLHYANPGAALTYCLNSKLASLTLEVSGPAGRRTLHTDRAALELGWPTADHGVVMVA